MKTKIYILVLIFLALMGILNAQTEAGSSSNLPPFNQAFWETYADKLHLNTAEKLEFITAHQKNHVTLVQQQATPSSPVAKGKSSSQNSILSTGCVNIDFEGGNLNGWTPTNGYNPLYTANTSGCCLIPGGQQSIMSGTGVDPAGGFPVVAPGGSYSLRLGSSQTGGLADRVEQTFLVTSANANFTYKYAVVLQDPGHTTSQQPYFQIEMLDSTGAQVPCTFYSVSASGNIPGFQSSTTMASVIYKPWSSVVADLTNLIGQNVTIRFTTYDCSLGGHFGYAYLDGSCLSFMKTSNDTICAGAQKSYCVPSGFLSTTWNGPGMVNNTSQCISASAPGVYTCQTVLIPGCPGPSFTYTLNNFPKAALSFTPQGTSACSQQYTFVNTSSISVGSLSSYTWSFGSGLTSSAVNPVHNYTATGNYSVTLFSTSDRGCKDTLRKTLSIFPFPVANFAAPATCLGSSTSFTNLSSVPAGTISSYSWSFGNGMVSASTDTSIIYSNSGSYPVTLSVISNQGCISTYTATLVIYPKPTAAFNSVSFNACSPQYSFTNTSSVSSGSVSASAWSFGSTGSSSLQNPAYSFPGNGSYTVGLIATSSQGCKDTSFQTLTIYPFPTVSFTAPSSCLSSAVQFVNGSSIPAGSISSYSWSFGNGTGSNAVNPAFTYSNSGTYVVTLSASSDQNCVVTTTGNVNIYPMPVASISVTGFCYNTNTSFTNNSTVSAGNLVQFGWDFGDGGSSAGSGGNHMYPAAGVYNISFSVTSNQNCRSTALSTVTIYPVPALLFNVANVCQGNATAFSNLSTIASGSVNSYAWQFGDGSSSAVTNPTLTYPGPGNYVVTLYAASNQNCTATHSGTVIIHPTPVLSFSPGRLCFSDTATFSGSSFISSGSLVSYAWQFGDGSTANTPVASHLYNNYGTYTVACSVMSDQNCPASYSSAVSIYPLPATSFSAASVCQGNTTSFVNSSSIPSGSINSWAWNFGGTMPVSFQRNPVCLYPGPGIYTVSLLATSVNNCTSSVTKTVSVFATPTPSFAVENSCQGQTSVFKNLSSIANPDQIVSTAWSFGNGNGSMDTDPLYTYPNGGNYSVKLIATSNNNCSQSYIFPLTIYSLPEVNFKPTFACMNQATQFINSSTIPSGTLSKCRWDFESDGIWDDTVNVNPVKTYPVHGNYTCKLQVVSSFQCIGNKSNDVRVYANPVADFTTRAVCLGDLTTFTNKSISAEGTITTYLWDFNGDNIVDNRLPNPTITYSANGTYLVRLEVQTQYGCINVKSMSGHINAMPVPNFISDNNKGCPGMPVDFVNTSSIGTGSIVSTQWNFGDGSAPDPSQNPSHTYLPGTYKVSLQLVSDSGCSASLNSPGFVTIYPKPVAGFNVNPEEVDETDPVISVSSSAVNASFTRYYINDGAFFTTDRFSHTFQNIDRIKPVVVQVVTNQYNCSDTLLRALDVKPAFVIYIPNTFTPNGDGLNDGFQAKGVGISKFSIQIFDRWGHLLYQADNLEDAWDGMVKGTTEPVKQDTYPWKATVVDIFNKSHDLSGHVSLIR